MPRHTPPLTLLAPVVSTLEQEYQAKLERAAMRRAAAEQKRHRAIAVCGLVGGKVRVKLKAATSEFQVLLPLPSLPPLRSLATPART